MLASVQRGLGRSRLADLRALQHPSLHSSASACADGSDRGEGASSDQRATQLLRDTLKTDLVAEEAATALLAGQRRALLNRPDAAALAEAEAERLEAVRELAPQHRVRPSLLTPALRLGFFALGAVAGLAPRRLGAAVTGGVAEALEEVFTQQLRDLRAAGLAEAAPDVRATVVGLRDGERAVEGAPAAPDLLPYLAGARKIQELTLEEGVAGAVKLGARLSLEAARRL